MSRTQVSILLPVHSDSPFLERCLQSLSNVRITEKTNLIVILDRVSSVISELVNNFDLGIPKKILVNSQFGLVNSLNLGLKEADGEFIARIDHDDMMHVDRLEKQLNFFHNNSEYVLVGSNVTLIDHSDKKIRESAYPLKNEEIIRVLNHKNVFAHPAVMYRRTAAINTGMYRKFYEGAEDYDLWLRMIKVGKVANLPESLTFYRQHPFQMSTMNARKQWILTEAVKSSGRLANKGKITLEQKYNTTENWYENSRLIRFKNRLAATKNFLGGLLRALLRS